LVLEAKSQIGISSIPEETAALFASGFVDGVPTVAGARPQGVATFWATGCTTITPKMQIFGADAEITFAGMVPGFPGLCRIDVRMPAATPGWQWLWFGSLPNPGRVYRIWVQ